MPCHMSQADVCKHLDDTSSLKTKPHETSGQPRRFDAYFFLCYAVVGCALALAGGTWWLSSNEHPNDANAAELRAWNAAELCANARTPPCILAPQLDLNASCSAANAIVLWNLTNTTGMYQHLVET